MRGFSLVELSIVLVILGLLTGGVLAGQNLIRAAELRSIPTQIESYRSAAHTFRDKYFALPGDMPNATAFWGDNSGLCSDTTVVDGTPGACNGDGDGRLDQNNEMYQIWVHLALAGLVEGSYSGQYNGSHWGNPSIGVSIPASRLSSVGVGAFYADLNSGYFPGAGEMYGVDYGNAFIVGRERASFLNQTAFLTTEEAWNIDTKSDDGRPAYGQVIGINWNNNCGRHLSGTAAYNNFDAEYALDRTGERCAIVFTKAF